MTGEPSGPGWPTTKAFFFACALPALLRASLRAAVLERQLPFDQTVDRLRDVPPFRVAFLRRPEWLLASLDRVLPVLPPWTCRRCLRRSLLLLDLWGRCGLRPRLHLGIRSTGTDLRAGHAWVTAGDRPGAADLATSSHACPEAFDL